MLVNQGVAIIDHFILLNKSESDEDQVNMENASVITDLKAIYNSIQKWIDINDEKCFKFTLKLFLALKLYGKALKVLFKQLEDKNMTQVKSSEQNILKVNKKVEFRAVWCECVLLI